MKSILLVVIVWIAGAGVVQSQQTKITLNCTGTNDTSEFNRIVSSTGPNSATLKLPAQGAKRCAVSQATIPANIILDNTDGAGITLKTGGTLRILGNVINPAGKQIFFNALAGQGSISFSGNKYLSVIYPEWWGAKTTTDDAPSLNACSAAAATLIAADIDLVSTYNLSSTWQVGPGSPYTFISLKGHGSGSGGTTLNWVGATDGLLLKFWANKYSNIERIRFQNGVSVGHTVGLRFTGPGNGTQSNNINIDNCVFAGFYYGLQAGDPTTDAAVSELSFRNVVFERNDTGFLGTSTGNTLDITFLTCSFVTNKSVGLDLGSSSDCHLFGGLFGENGIDIVGTAWTQTLSINGARFEMFNPEVSLLVGGVGTVAIRNCSFLGDTSRLTEKVIIRGETSLTFENNYVGRPGDSWTVYDFGTGGAGKDYQFVATSNIVRGKLLHIRPDNSVIDGLTTLINGVRGEVVWPALIPDALAGQGQLSEGALHVKLTPRRNTNYSIALSSDGDERLHFAHKTVDGFEIVSSNRTSNSNVTWSVAKN
jgi:hypothetical protein